MNSSDWYFYVPLLQFYYRNNQSTESADGGSFLNFYKPLEYISSVLYTNLIPNS